jgi:hypothetical protein
VDSLASDSPSLGDNMASPHTGSNRKLRIADCEITVRSLDHRLGAYHNDMTIVNDLVTSRVRKRTFRFATWFRFDTALLRVASGCKFSCDPLQRTKVRIRSMGSSRETSACWKWGACWVHSPRMKCDHKSGFALAAEKWQVACIRALATL